MSAEKKVFDILIEITKNLGLHFESSNMFDQVKQVTMFFVLFVSCWVSMAANLILTPETSDPPPISFGESTF
jgi:hypothetical protein